VCFSLLENSSGRCWRCPGAGNHCHGLAVGKSMVSGYEAGGKVAEDLRSHGGAKLYTTWLRL